MTTVTDAHIDALSRAKIQLMSRPDSAFFTTVCFSLKHVWEDSIPTAATDGRSIFFNPTSYLALTQGQRVSRLMHETLHVAMQHIGREADREHQRWNVACDYWINNELLARGFERIPTWLVDPKYIGLSSEEIYNLLPVSTTMPPSEVDIKAPEGDIEQLKLDVQDILVRASIQSKMAGDKAGTIPGEIQIFLNGLLNPKLPWNRLLQKYLRTFDKSDYSFKKLNRRFFPRHYLPSLHGEKLMNMAIAVDISGSVSDSDFHVFVSEIASILRMMKPEKISLIQFDTKIYSVDEVKSIQELMKVKFSGRGGTAIEPVLEWADKNKPQLLMVFSDGYFSFQVSECKSTTLWLIHNNKKFSPPFGKTIHYKI